MNADSVPLPLSLPLSKGPTKKQLNTVVNDPYTYSLDSNKEIIICYYLNNVWEKAANLMGYNAVDIIVSVDTKKFQFEYLMFYIKL